MRVSSRCSDNGTTTTRCIGEFETESDKGAEVDAVPEIDAGPEVDISPVVISGSETLENYIYLLWYGCISVNVREKLLRIMGGGGGGGVQRGL